MSLPDDDPLPATDRHPTVDARGVTVGDGGPATDSFVSFSLNPALPTITSGAAAAADPPLPEIPGFKFVRQIGEGGMGVVYEAVNRLDRRVAVKFMRLLPKRSEYLERFRKEAAALLDLDHPHIARIFEYAEHDDRPYFTMRLLTGGTLSSRKDSLRLNVRRAVDMMARIAEAVGYVHRRNLLHRDLKPSNILFDDEGRPFVSDFGLVREFDPDAPTTEMGDDGAKLAAGTGAAAGPSASTLTNPGRAMGTVPYMAPEQVRGEIAGPWTDVWALGVILFELLTGERPFDCSDAGALRARFRAGEMRVPRQLNPELDPEIERITLKCLERQPADRFANGDELAAALNQWLKQHEVETKPRRNRARLFIGIAIGIVSLVLAVAVAARISAPDDPKRALAKRINDGEPYLIVGENGFPRRQMVIHGIGVHAWLYDDGSYTIDAQRPALVEAFPDPMCDRYRLRAWVRHNRLSDPNSRVGLFALGIVVGEGQGAKRGFISLTISMDDQALRAIAPPRDGKPPAVVASSEWNLNWHGLANQLNGLTQLSQISHAAYNANERLSDPWQELTLEIEPERLTARWGNRELRSLDPRLAGKLPPNIKTAGVQLNELALRGSFGFIVSGGSASFKNVSIEPLTRTP